MDDSDTTQATSHAGQNRPQRGLFWPVIKTWRVLIGALRGFAAHNVMGLAASLSFYTLLSFAPLLVLLVWIGSLVGYDAQMTVLEHISDVAGPGAEQAAKTVFKSAGSSPDLGSAAGFASIGISLVGATTVFAQLQKALNQIWGIHSAPGNAIFGWLRKRVLSLGVIGGVIFVLIVSLLVSSLLGFVLTQGGQYWDIINQVITTSVLAFLFALLFRYLPDGRLPWPRVLRGGIITAILFAVGKWLIGYYLSSGNVGSAYGAASSLVLLLVWVYYSGAVFFFGAEIVRSWAVENGELIQPEKHAQVTVAASAGRRKRGNKSETEAASDAATTDEAEPAADQADESRATA